MGHKCCPHTPRCNGHYPDIPARAFADDAGVVRMIVGSTEYFPMSGPSLVNQNRSCKCSFNKTADGNPAHLAADEYLDSPIAFDNGTVISLVHTEFPGNRYNNSGPDAPYCTNGNHYPKCWDVSIGLVISHDWGATFSHPAPPPNHLVAAVPYKYNQVTHARTHSLTHSLTHLLNHSLNHSLNHLLNHSLNPSLQSQLASGWGDPSNIMKHPTDGYYYAAIWNRHQTGLQAPGICMMRSNHLLDPKSWRAWGGAGYTVSFADPYTLEPGTLNLLNNNQHTTHSPLSTPPPPPSPPPTGTEAQHVCTVTNLPAGDVESGCAAHGLVWSEYLKKFVVTLGCDQATTPVFKLATSDDLIHWSEAQVKGLQV
jgi:hypothetical protein